MLFLDFETRSTVDLKKVGLHRYAHHPSTEIVCTGYAVDDGAAHVEAGYPLLSIDYLLRSGERLVAHNAAFEREMLKAKCGITYPWELIIDTAALAARMSLPRGLDALSQALKLDEKKDMQGHRVMMKLARPRGGWEDDEFWEEEDRPEDFQALRDYCRQDVEVMRAIYKKLLPLSRTEQRLYSLTGTMNDRGVRVDLSAIPDALQLLDDHVRAGEEEFKAITGGHGVKSYARAAKALGLPDMRKPTVRNALKCPDGKRFRRLEDTGIPPEEGFSKEIVEYGVMTPKVRRALEIFQKLARSSPAKLTALQRRTSSDGRVRGALIYCGAERTGRWSSGGVQLHNLPRGLGEETDTAFEALAAGVLDVVYDDPVGTIAECLRGFFVGPFLVGDFAQIEARTLCWFAGQEDKVEMFRQKKDLYCAMASKIYGREITKKSEDPKLPAGITPRFIGKQVELGAGYGLGWQKFQWAMDEVFDIQLDAEFAMRVIATYREHSPKVVQWWRRLESAFTHVVQSGAARVVVDSKISMGNVEVGGLRYAYVELPSGRRLYYAEPEMTAEGVRYWGRNIYLGGKWDRVSTYGGKLAENIVQAFSRDVMADAMLRLEDAGFPLLLTVHDEIVVEDSGKHLLRDFQNTMMAVPSWASGLPVDVEVFQSRRYRK